MWMDAMALRSFVRKHGIHHSVPVDLSQALLGYDVTELAFTDQTLGCSIGHCIAVNASLHPFQKRMVIAHEMAHHILRHPNSLWLCTVGDWWYQQFEREAWHGAAFILVPLRPTVQMATERATMAEMEDALEVPKELIQLKLRMARLIM